MLNIVKGNVDISHIWLRNREKWRSMNFPEKKSLSCSRKTSWKQSRSPSQLHISTRVPQIQSSSDAPTWESKVDHLPVSRAPLQQGSGKIFLCGFPCDSCVSAKALWNLLPIWSEGSYGTLKEARPTHHDHTNMLTTLPDLGTLAAMGSA